MRRATKLRELPLRSVPRYELRATRNDKGDLGLDVWQLPSPATPHVEHPKRVAGLAGRNLELIEVRIFKQFRQEGIELTGMHGGDQRRFDLDEDRALRLGLAFRALAPMRSRANMRSVIEGIDAMTKEEAAYWLGMAMHRRYPRRVLSALRMLLIDPRRR
jgi:hypothetical protein